MKRPLSVMVIIAVSVLLVVLIVVEVRLYCTGFAGKTLFDWLSLLGVLAIPIGVWLGTTAIKTQQSKAQEKAEQKQQYKDALQTFIDTMTKLILEKDLLDAPEGSPARIIAQAQTTMTLSWLIDSHGHKAALLQFMHDANLIKNQNPVISFSTTINRERERSHNVLNYLAHWEGVKLYGADLHDAYLRQIDLRKADLRNVDLSKANLENTKLRG
jgi:Pentapeptide repeats (8 copies)